jgi:hypothetical protein
MLTLVEFILLLASLVFVYTEFIYQKFRKNHALSPIGKDVKLQQICSNVAVVVVLTFIGLPKFLYPDVKIFFNDQIMPDIGRYMGQSFMGLSCAVEKVVFIAWVVHCKSVEVALVNTRPGKEVQRYYLVIIQGVVRVGVMVVVLSIYISQQDIKDTITHLTVTDQVLQWHVLIFSCVVYVCGEAVFTIVNPISWGLMSPHLGVKFLTGVGVLANKTSMPRAGSGIDRRVASAGLSAAGILLS